MAIVIYTFGFKKVFEDGTESSVRHYQIPAESRDEALIQLGRTFCREDYEIILLDERKSIVWS